MKANENFARCLQNGADYSPRLAQNKVMQHTFRNPATSDPEYIEQLKRDYIESAVLLAKSFLKQAICRGNEGKKADALEARHNFEHFWRQALQMSQVLHNRNTLTQCGCPYPASTNRGDTPQISRR